MYLINLGKGFNLIEFLYVLICLWMLYWILFLNVIISVELLSGEIIVDVFVIVWFIFIFFFL